MAAATEADMPGKVQPIIERSVIREAGFSQIAGLCCRNPIHDRQGPQNVVGRMNLPLVYEGEAVFHIGPTRQSSLLAQHMDTMWDCDQFSLPEIVEEPGIV